MTDEQIWNALIKYMGPDSAYEALRVMNTGDFSSRAGSDAVNQQLLSLGVPAEIAPQLMQQGVTAWNAKNAAASQDAKALASGNDPGWTAGANDGGTIESIIQHNGLEAALPYMTPEQRAQYTGVGAAMGGVGQAGDFGYVEDPIPAPETEEQRRERLYGNDMAWLDDLFQQDPAAALEQAKSMGTTADPEVAAQQQALVDEIRSRGITSDQASRDAQQGVVDELGNIYNQGGQTERDRMLRAKARAESENWLKGQRQADMASLAERGMSGGGAEIATLLGDRQDAASRLSMADLQASADAEQRKMDALMSRAGLAGSMENSANAYQMGNSQLAGGLLGGMRSQSDAYQQGNADIISRVGQANKDFLRNAYSDMINRRNDWNKFSLDKQVDMSKYLSDLDARENATGYGFGYDTAARDTGTSNDYRTGYTANTIGAFTGQTPQVRGASSQQTMLTGAPQAHAGQAFSGGAAFAGNILSSLYGGKGGKNDKTELNNKTGGG